MPLTPDQIDDFVALTLPFYEKDRYTDLSAEFPEYLASELITSKRIRRKGGQSLDFKIQVRHTGNYSTSGLYDEDNLSVEDLMAEASVPWTFDKGGWSYDILEDFFQSPRETIISELLIRKHDCLSEIAEGRESRLFGEPSSSSEKIPYGMYYWFRTEAVASTGKYGGLNPTGTGLTGGCAGVSSTTYPRWANWTATYVTPTTDDLVKKVKKALIWTRFRPVVRFNELTFGELNRQMFTTYRVQEPLERLAETRNDNLGADLARYLDAVVIGGVPMRMSHYLEENDTEDPVFGVDYGVFKAVVKTGVDMMKTGPKPAPRQRNVRNVHYDTAMNYICTNRRRAFRITK